MAHAAGWFNRRGDVEGGGVKVVRVADQGRLPSGRSRGDGGAAGTKELGGREHSKRSVGGVGSVAARASGGCVGCLRTESRAQGLRCTR